MCLYGISLESISIVKGRHLLECLGVRETPVALSTVGVVTSSSMTFSTAVRVECLGVDK